jgi:hypothetical protein
MKALRLFVSCLVAFSHKVLSESVGFSETEFNSDYPSSVPSDLPSSFPSDLPSSVPSDFPSTVPSDFPSSFPSDTPSRVPSAWTESSLGLPEGFEVCRLSENEDFTALRTIRIFYIYELSLEAGVQISSATALVESVIQEAVLDMACTDGASSTERAHAVSIGDGDLSVGK